MSAGEHLGPQFKEAVNTWEGDGSYEMGESLKNAGHQYDEYRPLAKILQEAALHDKSNEHLYSGQYGPEGEHHEGAVMHFGLLATSNKKDVAETFSKGHMDWSGESEPKESFVYHIEPGAKAVPINAQERVITGDYRVHRLSVTRTSNGEEKRQLHLRCDG